MLQGCSVSFLQPPEWSEVIISEGQNDDANLASFHYGKHHQGYVNTLNKLLPGTAFVGSAPSAQPSPGC